jgi:hypothetical protein
MATVVVVLFIVALFAVFDIMGEGPPKTRLRTFVSWAGRIVSCVFLVGFDVLDISKTGGEVEELWSVFRAGIVFFTPVLTLGAFDVLKRHLREKGKGTHPQPALEQFLGWASVICALLATWGAMAFFGFHFP